jgi:DNA-binding NarL/FixJ family response regulator
VVIVDDHPAIRDGLIHRLSVYPEFTVCGEAADLPEALQVIAATAPDVAVIDIGLKQGDGLDLVKRLKARDCAAKLLVWSLQSDTVYAERALRAGAVGYIRKDEATDAIVEAIRSVLDGNIYLNPRVMDLIVRRNIAGADRDITPDSLTDLSDRELEVFRLTGQGLDTVQVAERLSVSPKTVETYKARIKDKLGLESGAEMLFRAVRWVIENG